MGVGYDWKEFLPPSAVSQWEGNTEIDFAFHLLVSRSSTGDVCLFHPEPRASDLKPMGNRNKMTVQQARIRANRADALVWREVTQCESTEESAQISACGTAMSFRSF